MPATNLAAIFQPGLLSHPDHDMNPQEYRVSQEVLIFLIQHQDRFLPTTATQPRPPITTTTTPPPLEKSTSPPAKYSGSFPSKDPPEILIPRRRTLSKKLDSSSGGGGGTFGVGKVLRRHKSTRSPQSPRLAVEEEEPRRVSEGSAPDASPTREEREGPLIASFSRWRPPPVQESREDGN